MFCSYCGQAAAANASSCAHCGKPLRSAPAQSSALVAFTVIFAITTIVAGWAAIYYAHDAAQAREAIGMLRPFGAEPPPPPPPPPGGTLQVAPVSPCGSDVGPNASGIPGGVPGGVPGGQMGGVIGGIISEPPPPSKTPKRVRVSQGVAEGNLVSQTPPVYPPIARQAHVEGPVVLQVIVNKEGTVENIRVISGHPMLVQAALDAVRQWHYKPYLLNGEPVEVETQVTVSFKLAQ